MDPPGGRPRARRESADDPDAHPHRRAAAEDEPRRAEPADAARREPSLQEIAEAANLPIEQARQVRAAARAATSLDQPVGDQEDAVVGDFLAGEELLPDEQVELSLRSQALQQALAALSERERQVLVLRYGLDDDEPKTLEEIGHRLGLTRERIRQIQVEALRRLASLRKSGPPALVGSGLLAQRVEGKSGARPRAARKARVKARLHQAITLPRSATERDRFKRPVTHRPALSPNAGTAKRPALAELP